ncbi:hypothetical protein [Streptomyces sp. NPDC093808]
MSGTTLGRLLEFSRPGSVSRTGYGRPSMLASHGPATWPYGA